MVGVLTMATGFGRVDIDESGQYFGSSEAAGGH